VGFVILCTRNSNLTFREDQKNETHQRINNKRKKGFRGYRGVTGIPGTTKETEGGKKKPRTPKSTDHAEGKEKTKGKKDVRLGLKRRQVFGGFFLGAGPWGTEKSNTKSGAHKGRQKRPSRKGRERGWCGRKNPVGKFNKGQK